MRGTATVVAGTVLLGCTRTLPSAGPSDAMPEASVQAVLVPPQPPSVAPEVPRLTAPAPGEATRTTVSSLDRDPMLRAQLPTLRDHFHLDHGDARGPFAVQRAELAGGRTALLVTRADESDPLVLVVDREQLAWSKTHPVAGIAPPFEHVTLAARPDGGVALFGYVATMHLVASRMWADDANPYAEIEVFTVDACDAMSAAYGPGVGWLVACATKSGTRAQRLQENLTSAWGHEGVQVGSASPVGRAALAFDSPSTWTLVQRVRAIGGDHLLTYRYDAGGMQVGAVSDVRAPTR